MKLAFSKRSSSGVRPIGIKVNIESGEIMKKMKKTKTEQPKIAITMSNKGGIGKSNMLSTITAALVAQGDVAGSSKIGSGKRR